MKGHNSVNSFWKQSEKRQITTLQGGKFQNVFEEKSFLTNQCKISGENLKQYMVVMDTHLCRKNFLNYLSFFITK